MGNGVIMRVLFVCGDHSASSIMAEAIMNRVGQGRFLACSAGGLPNGEVHTEARKLLLRKGYEVSGLRPKSLKEFVALASMREASPPFDFLITLSRRALDEISPVLPGCPAKIHWQIFDRAVAHDPKILAQGHDRLKFLIERFMAIPALRPSAKPLHESRKDRL